MDKLYIKKCPVCSGEHLVHLKTLTDYYATGETFSIGECSDCGFRFTSDAPVESQIGRYYETPDYISHSDTHKGMMNKVYHLVRSVMLGKKARLVIRSSRNLKRGRLLDIGAGTGYFAYEMAQRGWDVTAAEKNEQAREFARKSFEIKTMKPEDLAQLESHSFDAITMWHVLEHVEKLDEEWEMLYRLLKDNGCLTVAVPNCSSADENIYKELWAAYDVPRHLWHFSPSTMVRLAEKHGFRLIKSYPMPIDAFYVSMLSEKYRGRKNFFVRGIISGLKCYFKAKGHTELSSSVIYILKKKKNNEAE